MSQLAPNAKPLGPNVAQDGSVTYRLERWSELLGLLDNYIFAPGSNANYIWRGQRRSDWSLSSSLDRLFERLGLLGAGPDVLDERAAQQLEVFRYATRGRRGVAPTPIQSENGWWALGQHYGLATPLLDWSRSPYAAAYFAFEDTSEASDATDYRVVYGLDQRAVLLRNADVDNGPPIESGRIPILELFDPLSDDNPRLVSQGGLFTRAPTGTPVERWVAQAFEGINRPVLVRIEIPDSDRKACLRGLNRMNINHLSLFPDLIGASRYTNLRLDFEE